MKESFEKLNAPLYIDVVCYGCKRRVAMSNTNEIDGRRYCDRCAPPGLSKQEQGETDMKHHIFKLRSKRHGEHVRTTVFAGFGEEGTTLANCGTLTMNIGEWQAFGVMLMLGADHKPSPGVVITEGDEEVVGA